MDEYIGIVKLFAGNFAPKGWAFCQGQILPISQNNALYSIIGNAYGGDGITTFALPDLRSRVPVGTGQGPGLSNYAFGQVGGSESVTLTLPQMPAHIHTAEVKVSANIGNTNNPIGKVPGTVQAQVDRSGQPFPVNVYADASTGTAAANCTSILPSGGNQAHPNVQPYLGMNYIICLFGVYPPRD